MAKIDNVNSTDILLTKRPQSLTTNTLHANIVRQKKITRRKLYCCLTLLKLFAFMYKLDLLTDK